MSTTHVSIELDLTPDNLVVTRIKGADHLKVPKEELASLTLSPLDIVVMYLNACLADLEAIGSGWANVPAASKKVN